MSSHIRYANINDLDALANIHSKSLIASCKGIVPEEILNEYFTFERRKNSLFRELSQGSPETAIMFSDNQPVGMFTFGDSRYSEKEESLTEIWRIYILPSHWRQGIGTELMNWGINEIRRRGFNKAELWVLEENYRARHFYEKYGFKHDGKVRVINLGKEMNEYRYIIDLLPLY